MPLDPHREANRLNWEDRVPIHLKSQQYTDFTSDPGKLSRVVEFDRAELGDVQGKSLLHLQCHIGRDTLSWAKLGATVTGLDFSPRAIEAARKLSEASGVPGRFIESELYDAPTVLDEKFDIVYTGVGAICWLPDIRRWADVVARFLKPGGVFYIRKGHPVMWSLDDEREDEALVIGFPYFETAEPMRFDDEETTYEGDGSKLEHKTIYTWNHGLGEIVSALIDVGLRIVSLKEYRFCDWQARPTMQQDNDGHWRLPHNAERLPLMYSVRAVKDE